MSNKDTMSVEHIQTFLRSKNPCNNTNIKLAQRYPHLTYNIRNGKFVCMAEETFNGETAAQIIWQAAQDYTINPRVIIVLLEKEQGLITDTWPNHIQYRSATGFGCPDTAACDSQYYGLKNQIRHAAKLFRSVLDGGWTNYPVGPNYIRFSPVATCGGTTVNVKNRATSALYRYTPYQPNQAALRAGYGLGDNCSAYGNRNFYALFHDWFGSTTDIVWEKMSQPRWMSIAKDTRKMDLSDQNWQSDALLAGRHVHFTSKTTLNGVVYLRTSQDDSQRLDRGVALTSLAEIPFVPIENPRWMTITCPAVHKISPNTGISDTFILRRGRVVKFTSKTTVNGVTYLRTEMDSRINNNLAVAIDCVNTSEKTETIKFDTPRKLFIPRGSSFIDIRTQTKAVVEKNTSFLFSRKFSFNNVIYYQTSADFDTNRLIGIAADATEEHVNFVPMSSPRSLTLRKDISKTDLASGNIVGPVIPAGTTRPFIDKYQLRGRWYLRTKTDYDANAQSGIPLELLKDAPQAGN
ncbi:MAG: hypothetical protein Q4F02_00610 [Candidatus Saccharibacteria bacterium]|nr:hypothetical protein [Candidatus Saccharibacteria bacterium]